MKIFSYIKERISIFDLVNEYTTLKKAGSYYKASCPFHHEKTASFTISPEKNIFYCFGCHETGDVIGFFAKIEQCGQFDAAKLLAEKYKITIPNELLSQISTSTEEKELYFSICAHTQEWCKKQLQQFPEVIKYLTDRGFTPETIAAFNVGYFPGGQRVIQDFITYMRTKHILLKDIVQINILAEGRAVVYSPFENRIIFPITDILGRTIGFGGRIHKINDTRVKYYNSHENNYFTKGSILFGLQQAKSIIQKTKAVFLVEGYTDCLAMAQHGYKNTVATLGTACTIAHLKQLARYADRLYFVYDADKAGKQALLRVAQLCWQVNIEPFVIQLPTNEDPSSYLAKHLSIDHLIKNAHSIFSFFIQESGENFQEKSLQDKLEAIRSALAIINTIDDPLKQNILLQMAAKTFEMPLSSLQKELVTKGSEKETTTEVSTQSLKVIETTQSPSESDTQQLEKRLFCGILNNKTLLQNPEIQELIPCLPVELKDIIAAIQQKQNLLATENSQDEHSFLDENQQKLVNRIIISEGQYSDRETTLQIARQLQKKRWKTVVNDIKTKLAYAKNEQNNEVITQLLTQLVTVQKKLRLLNPDTMRIYDDKKEY